MIVNRVSKSMLFVAVVAVLVPVVAQAAIFKGKMKLDRISGYYSGSGGEFTISDLGTGFLDTSAYHADRTKDQSGTSFQTFCVELHEYAASPVDTWISTMFINEDTGALAGSGSHAITGGKTHGDNLDEATAYLYTQFATGVLSNFDYDAAGGRAADAGELQEAIWSIEERAAADGKAAAWITEANNSSWSGIGSVRILNMYLPVDDPANGPGTVLKQDQLYLAPTIQAPPAAAPLPASGLVWLGLFGSAVVIGWRRRRKHAA